MNKNNMDVAILIPCYNAAGYLPELFDGIIKQTIPFAEIICYDDCSTDNTVEIAINLGAKVIVGDINKGAAYARNRLLDVTTCSFIHFHDADDLIHPRFNELMQIAFLQQAQSLDVLLCNALVQDRDSRSSIGTIEYPELNEPHLETVKYFLNTIGFPIMGIYRKSIVDKIAGFNEELRANEDPDFHVRLAFSGAKFANLEDYLVTKLESPASFSHLYWDRCISDKLKCFEFYIDLLGEPYFEDLANVIARIFSYYARKRDFKQAKSAWLNLWKINPRILTFSVKAKLFSKYFGVFPTLFLLGIIQWLKYKKN